MILIRASIFSLLMLAWFIPALATEIHILVVDEQNIPLPMATLRYADRSYSSDDKGSFSLDVKGFPALVTISFVGYSDTTLSIKSIQRRITVQMRPTVTMLRDVSVQAQSNAKKSTSNVVHLAKDHLARNQESTLAGMLAEIPGLRVLSTGNMIEKPVIEGMYGSRIAIINNGTKLMGQHWGDDHAPEMSIPSYSDVRVEKGAESVKYGANAIGGVVVVESNLSPQEKSTKGSFHTSYSDNSHKFGGDGYIESYLPLLAGTRYRVGAKYYNSGDFHTAQYNLYNTGARLFDGNIDLATQLGSAVTFKQSFDLYNTRIGIFAGSHIGSIDDLLARFQTGRPEPAEIAPFTRKISAPMQHIIHFTSTSKFQYSPTLRDKLSLRIGYQNDYRREYEVRRGDLTNVPTFAFKLKTIDLNAEWFRQFADLGSMTVGADYVRNSNVTDHDTKSVPIIPNYVANKLSAYGLYFVRPTDRLQVESGLRSEYLYLNAAGFDKLGKFYGGKKDYFSVSGTLGMKYKIAQHSDLNSNVGLAWRPPEMNELFSYGLHHGDAIFQIGDETLRTEKALKWTVGYHLDNSVIDLSANAYFHYVFDYIYDVPKFTTDDNGNRVPEVFELVSGVYPVFYFQQSNGVFIGGDLTVKFQLNSHLDYTVSGEWIRGRNVTLHTYFPNIPSDRYRHELSYRNDFGMWNFGISFNHQYIDKQRNFSADIDLLPDTPPSYHLLGLDVHTEKSIGTHRLSLYAKVTNLNNALYKDYNNRMRFYAHDMGRSVTIGVRYTL